MLELFLSTHTQEPKSNPVDVTAPICGSDFSSLARSVARGLGGWRVLMVRDAALQLSGGGEVKCFKGGVGGAVLDKPAPDSVQGL